MHGEKVAALQLWRSPTTFSTSACFRRALLLRWTCSFVACHSWLDEARQAEVEHPERMPSGVVKLLRRLLLLSTPKEEWKEEEEGRLEATTIVPTRIKLQIVDRKQIGAQSCPGLPESGLRNLF